MIRVQRREFLTTASLAAAVALAKTTDAMAADEAPPPFRLNYILASPMYGTTPLAEVLPEVAKVSAEAIDIWPRRHANHREQVEELGHERFLQLLTEQSVQLGIVTRFDLGPYALQDEMRVRPQAGGPHDRDGRGAWSG